MSMSIKSAILAVLVFVSAGTSLAEDHGEAAARFAAVEMREVASRDGLRPLDRPRWSSVSDAGLVVDREDIVFVVDPGIISDKAYLLPRKILLRHGVVNFASVGRLVAVSYSPYTGTAVGMFGDIAGRKTSFGNSGRMLHGNLVLYDRASAGLWPQIPGTCVKGLYSGKRLEQFPVLWSSFAKARKVYPEAMVLSRNTGMRLPYDQDPVGSYHKQGTYYDSGPPPYPMPHKVHTLNAKERVLGVYLDGAAVALPRDVVKEQTIVEFECGMTPLLAMYDADLDSVRVFKRSGPKGELHFVTAGGIVVDRATKTVWSALGEAVKGRLEGEHLEQVAAIDAMWFAWLQFYPGTILHHEEF